MEALAAMPFEVFSLVADRYDEWYRRHRVTAMNEARLVEEALRGLPRPWVEVGVGTGFFAQRLGIDLGVDPSPEMLRVARRRGVEAVQALGEALPLRASSIGAAVLVVTLCFLDDPLPVLREAARAARPGGGLVACIVPRLSPWGIFYQERGSGGHPLYRVARFYTVEELLGLLPHAGLEAERILVSISYGPLEPPVPEEPREPLSPLDAERYGFACIAARKPGPRGEKGEAGWLG